MIRQMDNSPALQINSETDLVKLSNLSIPENGLNVEPILTQSNAQQLGSAASMMTPNNSSSFSSLTQRPTIANPILTALQNQ